MNYNPVICSSANISGDKKGGITDLETAIDFAKERQIQLIIKNEDNFTPRGSYPIFQIEGDTIQIVREMNIDSFMNNKQNHFFYSKILFKQD